MHVFETLEALVNDILLVDVLEDVSPDNCVQIGIHEVENEVNISIIFCPDDIL